MTDETGLHPSVLDSLRRFLDEDIGNGDITTESLGIAGTAAARIFPKSDCVVSGIEEVMAIFNILGVEAVAELEDGASAGRNRTVVSIQGDAAGILAGERLSLNLISRMSGIATLTRRLVTKCRRINPSVKVACTRKTTPGMRYFEKKAVMAGGGDPHRWRLDDAVLIKDNHLMLLPSVGEAVRRSKEAGFTKKIEIEVEDHDRALEAAGAGADIVMLDNFTPEQAAITYRSLKDSFPGITVEVSGGIGPDNIESYAASADVISLGWLTHSVKAVDFSLEMTLI
jgi:nicotinate-nucleotide pyrophosphorylase (carboxylating)